MDYPRRLLAVVSAPNVVAKAALLADIVPPDPCPAFPCPSLPPRPGRDPLYQEDHPWGRRPRRRTLAHGPTRERFLLALHHIELSAIDLAVLGCLHGGGWHGEFHREQLRIAREEAVHAGLVETLLIRRGLVPGAGGVHFRLWQTACQAADLGEHLVIVPLILEARGLDASQDVLPGLKAADLPIHEVVQRIYTDEITHVAMGNRWHQRWCAERGLDRAAHMSAVIAAHFPPEGGFRPAGPGPLDIPGRLMAGFTADELAVLDPGCMSRTPKPQGEGLARLPGPA